MELRKMPRKVEMVKAMQDEIAARSGECGRETAEALFAYRGIGFVSDLQCRSALHAAAQDPEMALYLGNLWVGQNRGDLGREIRQALAQYERGEELAAELEAADEPPADTAKMAPKEMGAEELEAEAERLRSILEKLSGRELSGAKSRLRAVEKRLVGKAALQLAEAMAS